MVSEPTYEELEQRIKELESSATEHKRLEKKLRENEEKYRSILESLEDGYAEVDLKGNFTFVNTTAAKQLGSSQEDVLGKNFSCFVDESEAKKMFETFNQVFITGKPAHQVGFTLIGPHDVKKQIEITASLIRDVDGNPVGFGGINRDVTERTRADETLRQSQANYRNLLLNVGAGYYELDLAGNITKGWDAENNVIGGSADEFVGKNFAEFCDDLMDNFGSFADFLGCGEV